MCILAGVSENLIIWVSDRILLIVQVCTCGSIVNMAIFIMGKDDLKPSFQHLNISLSKH